MAKIQREDQELHCEDSILQKNQNVRLDLKRKAIALTYSYRIKHS